MCCTRSDGVLDQGVLAFHSICLVVGCFAILPSFLNGSFKSSSALFIVSRFSIARGKA